VVSVGHLAVNDGGSLLRVGYLAERDLLLAPEVPRHLAAGPLDDLGVAEVGGRIRVWEGRCWRSTFGPEGEMFLVTLSVECWVCMS
jgi:hypothetical protein